MAALASGDVDRAVHGPVGSGRLGTLVGRSVDGLARSISERDRLQRRLAHEASHDALTGLANRQTRSEEHTSDLQSLMRIWDAGILLTKKSNIISCTNKNGIA